MSELKLMKAEPVFIKLVVEQKNCCLSLSINTHSADWSEREYIYICFCTFFKNKQKNTLQFIQWLLFYKTSCDYHFLFVWNILNIYSFGIINMGNLQYIYGIIKEIGWNGNKILLWDILLLVDERNQILRRI